MQQTAREEQAAIGVCDYNKRRAMEEMAMKAYQLQKQWYDGEMKLAAEYEQVMRKGLRSGVVTGAPAGVTTAAPVQYAAPTTFGTTTMAAPTTMIAAPTTMIAA